MSEPIRISVSDLQQQSVNEYVELQAHLRRDVGAISDQPWLIRVIYANWFYLAVCSMIGGLVGWAIIEPFITDGPDEVEGFQWVAVFASSIIASCVSLFLGAGEGIICRNFPRALKSGVIGLGIGFVGGLIVFIPAGFVFGFMKLFSESLDDGAREDVMPTGIALLVLMMGRSAAWSIIALPAGIGQGIAVREKKVVINGAVGAVLGGLVGGLIFDPVYMLLKSDDGQAFASRGVGFAIIGCFVGLFVGLVEGWTKTAWLMMRKGPLAGKQFILFKDTTVLGSSPKADIYLFKDDAIEPRHATVVNRGGRFEIEDCNTPDGTYVNGIPIKSHVLSDGDQIVLGKTVLEFSVTEAGK